MVSIGFEEASVFFAPNCVEAYPLNERIGVSLQQEAIS